MIGRAPREATGAEGKLVEATTVTASLELTWCNIVIGDHDNDGGDGGAVDDDNDGDVGDDDVNWFQTPAVTSTV